jgi:uncharacterized low-complexity protein
MNNKTLTVALGGAFAATLAVAPVAGAAENPFAMQVLPGSLVMAEAGAKMKDGKCGEGKCGGKMKTESEAAAKDMGKTKEGNCGANKMKEGGCSGSMKMEDSGQPAPTGQ